MATTTFASNDFTRWSEDENKNTINKIYARLVVVARVDLCGAPYSIYEAACVHRTSNCTHALMATLGAARDILPQ